MPLKVTSRPIELTSIPTGDFLFARSNQTLVGQGTALRLSATGPDRISTLASKWWSTNGPFLSERVMLSTLYFLRRETIIDCVRRLLRVR